MTSAVFVVRVGTTHVKDPQHEHYKTHNSQISMSIYTPQQSTYCTVHIVHTLL